VLVKVTVKYDDKEKIKLVKISEDRSIINFGGNNPEDKDFSISSLKIKADSQEIAAGVNPFIPTEQEKLSTFATDVDTASYTLMRNSVVSAGSIPSKDSVRIEEYLNYFNYNYEKPTKAKFSIHTDLVPSIFGKDPNKKILRVGIQGKEIKIENRKNAILTFVVDTSGSMSEKNKLEIIKSSLKIFLKQMTSKDKISIVSYSEKATTLLDNATLEQEAKILEVINSLKATTSTNIEAGLKEGYKIAQKNYVSGAINRILLCSDGVSNLGANKPQELLNLLKSKVKLVLIYLLLELALKM
jgi:Ca-activated chloride channel family protein